MSEPSQGATAYKNIPRKIDASQAEVVHVYVDASFDRQKSTCPEKLCLSSERP